MKNILKTILYLALPIIILDFWLFRYDDWQNRCHIAIRPSLLELSNLQIKRALTVLRFGMPEEYKSVCQNIRVIEPDLPCGGSGGGCFETGRPDRIIVSTTHGGTAGHTASIIVHEKCHYLQKKENRTLSEDECYQEGDKVISALVQF